MKIKSAIYQILCDCKESKVGIIEIATSSGSYCKMFDLVDSGDLFSWIVLKGYYKENVVEWKKGVEIKVVEDAEGNLLEIIPPTLGRKY